MRENRRVFDCFTFSEETLLVQKRIEYLADLVDYFVIVESSISFQGTHRNLRFPSVIENLTVHADKIRYITVHEFPDGDAWVRENYQRNAIQLGLQDALDDDIIIVGDADEIPSRAAVSAIRRGGLDGPAALEMRFSFYHVNMCSEKWWHAKAASFGHLTTPQALRDQRGLPVISDAGWHISYLGSVEFIQKKLKSFAHVEYSSLLWTSPRHIQRCIRLGVRLFGEQRFRVVGDELAFPGLPRSEYPDLFGAPLNAFQTMYAVGYLYATNHRKTIPQSVADKAPLVAIGLALPLELARRCRVFARRRLRSIRKWSVQFFGWS